MLEKGEENQQVDLERIDSLAGAIRETLDGIDEKIHPHDHKNDMRTRSSYFYNTQDFIKLQWVGERKVGLGVLASDVLGV